MDFLRPALLWGILAVSVPVLIHLLGQRRVRTVPIATLRFLEKARVRASAHLKLRRILLLLSRMAVLAALAVLYAGPGCRIPGRPGGAAAWVLVLDTSPSMAASREGKIPLEEGRRALLEVLGSAGPEDRFLFATTRQGEGSPWSRGFSADAASVRRQIQDAGVEYGPHRVDRALENAFALARGATGGRVVLATDLQASGWGAEAIRDPASPLRLVDVGLRDPRNTWVDGVEEGEGGLEVRLGSMGAVGSGRRTVRLETGRGPGLTAFVKGDRASFQAQPAGLSWGAATVDPGGDLSLDDGISFVARGRARTRVLLVNGDPREFEIRDELLFVRRALTLDGKLAEQFDVREVRLGDLSPADLTDVDVVFLANPGPLSQGPGRDLLERVRAGTGLVVTMGDRWEPGTGAEGLEAVLAAPLRDRVVIPPDDPSRPPFELLDPRSFLGPMTFFRDRPDVDLSQTRVRRYWAVDARAGEEVRTWMRLENGAPLLVERQVGKGKSLLFATTIDRDGADFCLQPAFLPWLDRVLLYAAGRLRPPLDRWATAGMPVAFPYQTRVLVEEPKGNRVSWGPGAPPYVPPVPGVYRILSGGALLDAFAARIAAAESDLTRLTPDQLAARLGPAREALDGDAVGRGRQDLSAWVAAALLAALAAEALLSGRWGLRRKAQVLGEDRP